MPKLCDMNRVEVVQFLMEQGFTAEGLLDSIMQAMSEKEAHDNYEFICRMEGIPYDSDFFGEEEE